jgi:hypothetical protein
VRRHPVALALVAWTFLVWTTRLANIWRDPDLDTGDRWGSTALALSFMALAAAVAGALIGGRRRRAGRAVLVTVGVLAGWTTAVWVVRGVGIVAADHELGFEVVHGALAVVSVGLAAAAWREAWRRTRGRPSAVAPGCGGPAGSAPAGPDEPTVPSGPVRAGPPG